MSAITNRRAVLAGAAAAIPAAALTLPALAAEAGADAELLALVDRFFAAEAAVRDQTERDARAREAWEAAHPMPDVLRFTPEDAALGLPPPSSTTPDGPAETFYARPDMFGLEKLLPAEPPQEPAAGADVVAWEVHRFLSRMNEARPIVEPPAARTARVEDILDALDDWREVMDVDYPNEDAFNAACGLQFDIEQDIAATPATTAVGLKAKLRVMRYYLGPNLDGEGGSLDDGLSDAGPQTDLALSIMRDIAGLPAIVAASPSVVRS